MDNYMSSGFNYSYNHDNKTLLFESDEGFILGNMFKEIYQNYKGFSNYCFHPLNKKQQLLLETQIYDFVILDLNLYLDTHPNDQNTRKIMKEAKKKYQQALMAYESEYGPLTVMGSIDNKEKWVQGPWPWQKQN